MSSTSSSSFDPTMYQNLPIVYGVFTGLWALAALAWVGHIAYYRYKGLSLALHTMICSVPILKAIHTGSAIYFYYDCAFNGLNSCTVGPMIGTNIANLAFEVILFQALLYLSKGISITRTSMDSSEKRSIIWNLICLGLCIVAKTFNVFFVVCICVMILLTCHQFPLYVIYVILIGHAFSAIGVNVKLLNHRYADVELGMVLDVNVMKSPTFMKIGLFKKLRFVLLMFVVSYVMVSVVLVVFTFVGEVRKDVWIQLTTLEAIQFAVCALVALLLRLRDFSDYERVDERVEALRRERRVQNRATARNNLANLLNGYLNTDIPMQQEPQQEEQSDNRKVLKFATKMHPITKTPCLCMIENPVAKDSNQNQYAMAVESES